MKDFLLYVLMTLVSVCVLRMIRSYYHDIVVPSTLAIVVFLSGLALSILLPVVEYVSELAKTYQIEYLSVLWKALAVSIVTTTSADLCRSSEEEAIASKIELIGKCELLLLALPLLQSLTGLMLNIIEESL